MQKQTAGPHRRGWNVYYRKFAPVLFLLLFQLLLRVLAFAPLLYAVISGGFFGLNPDHAPALGFLASLPLNVLIVLPFRFQAAARMAVLHGSLAADGVNGRNYLIWLRAALYRLFRALPFILPLSAFLVLFYYYMRVPGFNESLLAIESAGKLVGGDYPAGIALIMLAGIITAVVAYIGLRRSLAFEHQRVIELGVMKAWREGRLLSKRRSRRIRRTVRINALLTLPAFAGVMFVLVSHLLSLKQSGMLIFDFLNAVSVLLTLNFPTSSVYQILMMLAVLWLPVLPWRKLALSAVLAPTRAVDGEQ